MLFDFSHCQNILAILNAYNWNSWHFLQGKFISITILNDIDLAFIIWLSMQPSCEINWQYNSPISVINYHQSTRSHYLIQCAYKFIRGNEYLYIWALLVQWQHTNLEHGQLFILLTIVAWPHSLGQLSFFFTRRTKSLNTNLYKWK